MQQPLSAPQNLQTSLGGSDINGALGFLREMVCIFETCGFALDKHHMISISTFFLFLKSL